MTDFKIPKDILFIIKESEAHNSSDINKAINFLKKKIQKTEAIEKFEEKIKKLKKKSDKEDEEKKFLEYLHKEFLKQQKEYDERRKIEQEEKRKAEQELKKKVDLQIKFESIDWDYIKLSLSDYIIADLKQLFQKINNSQLNKLTTKKNIDELYQNYNKIIDNIEGYFKDLWTNSVGDFFRRNYDFKLESDLLKLEKLKHVIEKYNKIKESNYDISIDLAENFLHAQQKENESQEISEKLNEETNVKINAVNEYENIILAIKIAHTVFMNYITELEENFKELRKDFDKSVSDELIYVALFVNNNYIDDARAFIEKKKNSGEEVAEENWETSENVVMPNTSSNSGSNSGNSTFLTEINKIRTPLHKTEAEIIQEYDEEVKKLHESQQNYIIVDGQKYNISDFINKCLTDDTLYQHLDNLYNSAEYIQEHLKIPNIDLLDKYRKLFNCNFNTLKKRYIKYKIFEEFFNKYREILSDFNVNRIYNSNRVVHDMFIKLILFYNKILNIDTIHIDDLNIYLKIIACVIIKYYRKSEGPTSNIIREKITDPQEQKLALEYINNLFELFREIHVSNEDYFKLFAKLRKNKQSHFVQESNSYPQKSSTPFFNKAEQMAEQYNNKFNTRRTFKRALPPVQKSTKNTSKPSKLDINTQVIVKRKIKATDEDKFQIITKSFEDMDKKDSLFKPLLGFHDNILFEKNNEFADINTIIELKKIYEKNNEILDIFFGLLNTLSQLISLKDKNEKDYYDIEQKLSRLILVLEQLSDIFRTSISDSSEGAKITQLFNIIINNIESNLIDKYNDEKSQKLKNKERNKLTKDDLIKYLKILEINIEELNGKSLEEINNLINRQFRKLSKKTHSDKTRSSTNNVAVVQVNDTKFHKLLEAKDKLKYFYSEQNSENNKSNETNYNTNEYRIFRNNYLKQYPKFMPIAASAQNFKNIENKLRTEYRKHLKSVNNTTRKDLLNDIIIPRIRESIDIGKLYELTPDSLMRLFELFTPFNFLYDSKFNGLNSLLGNFILSIDNNLVKRFNILISSSLRFDEYKQLCFNMDNYIKYILFDLSFIDNIENNDSFKIIVYYNFFHNLKSIMEIILDYLTNKNPRYKIFFNLKKKLDEIIQNFKKLDKDKKYSIVLDTEKTKNGIFASNRFNVRKVGKEQIKKQRETIMKTTKQLFEKLNSKNKTNHFFKKFDETKENKDKRILLLKKIKELLDELINEYNISFENLLKSDNLKNIIKSFFEKINTNLQENYSQTYVNELIDSLFRINDKDKVKFLKKSIFEPVINQLVDKLITFGYKQVKFNILELLYIFAISFSSENQQLRNIQQQRINIMRVNQNVSQVVTEIKTENKQHKLALIVIEELKQKADQLEGTLANPQQKQNELEKTLSNSMKKHNVSPNLLAVTLSTVKPKMNTNSGKEFMKGINKLLLTNSSTKSTTVLNNKPKTTSKNSNVVVPNTSSYRSLNTSVPNPLSYNSLTPQNKNKVVKKLKSAITKGNIESKRNKINKIAAEINSNRPNHITTIDEFEKEIIKRFKPNVFKLTDEEETKFIQELSHKKSTDAKQKQYLEKILSIITEIKKDKSIKSLTEFKNKVREKLK